MLLIKRAASECEIRPTLELSERPALLLVRRAHHRRCAREGLTEPMMPYKVARMQAPPARRGQFPNIFNKMDQDALTKLSTAPAVEQFQTYSSATSQKTLIAPLGLLSFANNS